MLMTKNWIKKGIVVGICFTGIMSSSIVCDAYTDEVETKEIDGGYGLAFDLTLDEFKENYSELRKNYFENTEFEDSWEEKLQDEHIISMDDDIVSQPDYYTEPYTYEMQVGYGGEFTDYNYVSRLLGNLIAQMTVTVDDNNDVIAVHYIFGNEDQEIMDVDWTNFVLILQALNLDSDEVLNELQENGEKLGVIISYKDGIAVYGKNADSGNPMLLVDAIDKDCFKQYFGDFSDIIDD